jgi:nucleoside phosphorylase
VRGARERGLPWLALRAVSDTADEQLPALLERARAVAGDALDAGGPLVDAADRIFADADLSAG